MKKFNYNFKYAVIVICTFVFTASIFNLTDLLKIDKETISAAQKIIGLNFSEAEKDSMQDALNDQLKNINNIRKHSISNSVPPSITFNPIPVGFKVDKRQKPVVFSSYSYSKMPNDIKDLAYYSIGELAYLIKSRKISSVELTKFYIDRLKNISPKLFCVITLTEELALKQASLADAEIARGIYRGFLHGIPYGVKDLLSTKNYNTTWGAAPYKEQMINEDATVIKKLTDAGAVLCAKFSMGELAMDDVWFGGMTRNPWDTSQGSSGSSAGSASAVSAALVPFAIGTETWGSIVSPATVCGVTGLRPTYGRVSRTGAMALSWSMDKIGPICRNVEDLAIVFNAIKGADEQDQSLIDAAFNYSPKINLKNIRIGYLKKDFDAKYDFHQTDSIALKKLESLGANLIPIELPEVSTNDLAIILTAEAGAAFDELTREGKDDLLARQFKGAWPNIFRASRFIPAAEYINASRLRYLLIQEMKKVFEKVDLYIAPSWQGDNLLSTNLTGHPSVVVPNGFSKKGMPVSFTFIGNLFDEAKIISVAKSYQDATDFHKMHPSIK